MKKGVFIAALVLLTLCGCQRQKICGVPIVGTPWELAASLADRGDGSFIPECVYHINTDEAIIEGWLETDDSIKRPFIWLQLDGGQVVSAEFRTTLEEEEVCTR